MNISGRKAKFILAIFFFLSTFAFESQIFSTEFEKEKYFSDEEYEYLMEIISKVNFHTFNKLKAYEMLTSKPSLEKYIDKNPRFKDQLLDVRPVPGHEDDCLNLLLDPKLLHYDEGFLRMLFSIDPNYALEMASLCIQRTTHIFQIIKSIDRQLYEEIIAVDPNGLSHIQILYEDGYGFGISFSQEDGLPIFIVEESAFEWSLEEQRFCLGRELGRYVLGHFYDIAKYKKLIWVLANDKMTMRQLHFMRMFENVFLKKFEDEANRFAVLDLGLSIDDGINNAKKFAEKEYKPISFEEDILNDKYLFWTERIQYFNELYWLAQKLKSYEAQSKKEINWKEIAKSYLKLHEELDDRTYNFLTPEQERILEKVS